MEPIAATIEAVPLLARLKALTAFPIVYLERRQRMLKVDVDASQPSFAVR